MFALLLIIALVTAMAGMFAIAIRQIANARRQQYLEEAALNGFACAETAEIQRKLARQQAANARSRVAARKEAQRIPARRPHSPLLAR